MDRLFLKLPEVPQNIFWGDDFTWIYYRQADKLYRAAWRWGAQAEEVLKLPAELIGDPPSIVELWQDTESGRWRMKTHERAGNADIAGVWEYSSEQARWAVLRKVPTQCECGSCPCADVVNDDVHKAGAVSLEELLEAMRVEAHLTRTAQVVDEESEGPRYFPSEAVAERGIKVAVEVGDAAHAIAPVIYVNEHSGEEKTLYAELEDCFPYPQIAFQEEENFLLVGTEYYGQCPQVVDMRTGDVLSHLPPSARNAVWASPPASE